MNNTSVFSLPEWIISLFAPHDCLGCGQEGSLLCQACSLDITPLPERCYGCSKLSRESAVCSTCRRHSPLKHVWVRAQYDTVVKDLIYALKFGRARAATEAIVGLMAESLPHLPPDTIVVPVPTATQRVRHRGYDQAVLLARALAANKQLSYGHHLARIGQSRQVGADRKSRQKQLQQAFRTLRTPTIAGKNILLVDDIVTTGATLEAAAIVHKAAGARSVNAIVFAQKR